MSDGVALDEIGQKIIEAIDAEDIVLVESIIRENEFILFQQIDPETGEVDEDDDGNFSVVIAEMEEDSAVVCFTSKEIAENFVEEAVQDLPEGGELPAVMLTGDDVLDGLPPDCGLLLNPTSEGECFFPPGTFGGGLDEEE